MSGKRRENTFRIDYSRIPKKPTYEDLHHLVGVKLGLKREEVLRLQCSRIHGCAFVKTCDLQTAQRIVEEHDGKHTFEVDKKAYTLRMWMEDGGVDVRLYDLSEDVSDVAITEFMAAYGDIISIREVMWEDKYSFGAIPNGVRVVRMVVKKNIPSIVTIDGEATSVLYQGQLSTCRHCGELSHSGIPCVQNKKLLVQKLDADHKPSYANVARLPSNTAGTSIGQKQRDLQPHTKSATTPSSSGHSLPDPITSRSKKITTQHSHPPPAYEFRKPRSAQRTGSTTRTMSQNNDDENVQNNENGNETDGSTTSNGSRTSRGRPPVKKVRQDDGAVPSTEATTNNNGL